MVPAKRLVLLFAVGVILILVLGTDKTSLSLALAYDLLLIGAFFLDWFFTPSPKLFQLTRDFEDKMSLGAENPVKITIHNLSESKVRMRIKDEPPLMNFNSSGQEQLLEIVPFERRSYIYHAVPAKRGDYTFGRINFRYYSKLGLFIRQAKAEPVNNSFKVYPNLIDIRRHALKAQKGFLRETGVKPSVTRGLGTDFEGLREYVPDDEYRRVNWTASARRGKLVSNEYQDEKSQNILIVIDSGRMMTARVDRLSKFDLAINAGLLLGYVGVARDDKVGLAVFDSKVRLFMQPQKGKGQLHKITASLYNIQPEVVESDYRRACHYLMENNKKRSLVCIFTDLIDPEASKQLINYISVLTKRHLVVCITLIDADLIKTTRNIPENSKELYEKAVAESVIQDRERAIAILRNMGVAVVNVPAEELSVATINKYLELKARGRL